MDDTDRFIIDTLGELIGVLESESVITEEQAEQITVAGEDQSNDIDEPLFDGPKDETIGIAVSEEMHAFYQELRRSDEPDVDVTQSVRSHLEDLAREHEEVHEKAMRKLEIDREM